MNTIYLSNDATAQRLARVAFPSYSGHKLKVSVHDGLMRLTSCWSGGSRDYYQIVRLADMVSVPVPDNGSGFTPNIPDYQMRPGFAVIEHTIFMGKDLGVTIHLHPENATALLPTPAELTRNEQIVLVATRSLKSSYAGISNFRFSEAKRQTGITLAEYESAKQALIARGFLNKAGAITDAGRNAAGSKDLYHLKGAA